MKTPKSSVPIAKLLKSEGFSDHVANMVEKYWLRNIFRGRAKYRNLDKSFGEHIAAKLDDGQKLILGKFISMHKRQSFDTGIRIGLTAFATKGDFIGITLTDEVEALRKELDEAQEIIANLRTASRFGVETKT